MGSFGQEPSWAVDQDPFWGSTLSMEITQGDSFDFQVDDNDDEGMDIDVSINYTADHHNWEIPVIDVSASSVASIARSHEDWLCSHQVDNNNQDDDDDYHHHQSNKFATSSPTSTRQECIASTAALVFSGGDHNQMYCRVHQDIAMGIHHHTAHTTHYVSGSKGNSGISQRLGPWPWTTKPRRRAKSLDADKDFMLLKKKPRRSRRWTSCPTQVGAFWDEERRLRNRRYLCESSVRQLYEDRKDHIFEIFSETWLLTDALKDELL